MTIEDRIRAAAHARVDLVREIRPLDIPERQFHRKLRVPTTRRIGWLAPVTAAAVVIALAITLVTVRQTPNDGSGSGSAVAASAASATALPRYYVAVNSGVIVNGVSPATVADSRTGAVLTTVRPPAHSAFAGVIGAADDRTFLLDTIPASGSSGQITHVWYLLHIATGSGRAVVTRLPLPIPFISGELQGLALSPDGRTLAVMFRPAVDGKRADHITDGRTLAFKYPLDTWPDSVRLLDTASKGSDFVTVSKPVLAVPGNQDVCADPLAATDGRTIVCGTASNVAGGCVKAEPEFNLWSTATGKLTRVLYRYTGTCKDAFASVLWAGPNGTMIGVIEAHTYTGKVLHATTTAIGVIGQGRFTLLHISVPAYAPYGAIAF